MIIVRNDSYYKNLEKLSSANIYIFLEVTFYVFKWHPRSTQMYHEEIEQIKHGVVVNLELSP